MPAFALTIAYWLHMLATVVWLGGLAALSLIILPAARKSLEPAAQSKLLAQIQQRFQPVGWFSLAILAVTGMFQMSAHPAYQGFLAIDSSWAAAILIKHLVIGLMVLAAGYMTWGVLPALQRSALMLAAGNQVDAAQIDRLRRREVTILRVNLALSVVVLLLTAWARTSG